MAGEEDRPSAHGSDPSLPRPGAPGEGLGVVAAEEELGAAERSASRPAEAAAATVMPGPAGSSASPADRPRSVMPALLAAIGGVLIVLLAANLYGLYNPPANDAVPALQADLSQLRRQVDALAKRPPVDLGPLDARLSATDERVAGLAATVQRDAGGAAAAAEAKAAVQPLAARVDELRGAVDALGGKVAALPTIDLAPLDARVDDLGKRLPPLEAYFAAPKTGERVTEARQNGSAAESRAAPVAVIAGGVLDALRDGRPFEPEVRALAGLGVDAQVLAPLTAVATKGARTDGDLVSGFAAVQDAAVVAAAPVATGTMLDRMMANAQSLVKVSRTGAAAGEDAGAGASRILTFLKGGDLPAAAAEWDRLPEASRARSAEWGAGLKARVAADAAARALQRTAVEALAASVPAP